MAQKKLDKEHWNARKIIKKFTKHFLFVGISVVIMHTFMAYLVGTEETWEIINSSPQANPGGFIAMIALTGLFYGVFARFREQVCTTVCPYGRLQGVLLDKDSMVVAYDYQRGEKRSKLRKNEDRSEVGKGDCIDCKQCVFVCPTGIDIRNGTQLECVNCTACMDACDSIMDKIAKPKGLIRYDSEEGIKNGTPFRFTKRMIAYTVVLVLLLTLSGSQLLLRSDLDVTILRTPGVLYQKRDDGSISNLYNLKIINKTNQEMTVKLIPEDKASRLEWVGDDLNIAPNEMGSGSFFVIKERKDIKRVSSKIRIQVVENGEVIETFKTSFLGPMNASKNN